MSEPPARVPIACTLTPVQATERTGEFEALARQALIGADDLGDHIRLHLSPLDGVEALARDLAAREQQCCAFLQIDVTAADDEVIIDITGPPDARPVLELFLALDRA